MYGCLAVVEIDAFFNQPPTHIAFLSSRNGSNRIRWCDLGRVYFESRSWISFERYWCWTALTQYNLASHISSSVKGSFRNLASVVLRRRTALWHKAVIRNNRFRDEERSSKFQIGGGVAIWWVRAAELFFSSKSVEWSSDRGNDDSGQELELSCNQPTGGQHFLIFLLTALEWHSQPDSFYQQCVSIEHLKSFPVYNTCDYEQTLSIERDGCSAKCTQWTNLSIDSKGCFPNWVLVDIFWQASQV